MMIQFLLTTILVYFFGGFIGYAVHWMFHQPWSGVFYKVHKTHHEVKYPSGSFLSDEYRSAGKDNTSPYFILAVIILLLPFFIMLQLFSIPTWIIVTIIVESVVIGFITNYMHDSLHIRGHFFEKFRIFRKWRISHRIHHANVRYNLGIISFEWDYILKSWRRPNIYKN